MKDPAFLFYSNDFLSGTMLMTNEQIGQYIKLLCLQHQKGRLKEKDMLNICKTHDEDIFSKFKKDENGNYYNQRLEDEILRRKKYSESRRKNRKNKVLEEVAVEEEKTYEKDMLNICKTYDEDMKNICNSYEKHMETETETITKNKNININNNINKKNIKEKLQKKFIECTASTNLNAINECLSYLDDLPLEVIEIALNKTSEVNGGWKYAKTILNSWVEQKIDTVEKVKTEELKFKNKNKPREETEEQRKERRRKEMEEIIKNGTG